MKYNEKTLYKAKADVIKALSHPTRLWIVDVLGKSERCVCEFVEAADCDFSTVSRHLSVLKQAGIVEDEKRGKQVFYKLKCPCILGFINCIPKVIESQFESNKKLCEAF